MNRRSRDDRGNSSRRLEKSNFADHIPGSYLCDLLLAVEDVSGPGDDDEEFLSDLTAVREVGARIQIDLVCMLRYALAISTRQLREDRNAFQ
ncbi:MAG: hypothetical protein A2Z12_01940 [Actinobacteria bacterium RBG_16_68_21]|nr:MAG: hypothetical protein A2Z12_01940 [Actinobacteria bacterium RBG_16_68_21]